MRDPLKLYGALSLVTLIALLFLVRWIAPPPPKTVTFASGGADGQYYALAMRYRDDLARHGIQVEVLETAGTIDNFERLKSGEADIALLQGGLAGPAERDQLLSLGGLFAEPFWVFARVELGADKFGDLRTAKLAAGGAGSGTRALALELKAAWGGAWAEPVDLSGAAAAKALRDGVVEAAIFSAAIEAPYIDELLRSPGIALIEVAQAEGVSIRYPALEPAILYEGVVDLGADIPATDKSLITSIAQLGVRQDLHPAIQAVLLEAAEQIHGQGSLLARAGRFPDQTLVDLPLSEEARRFYRSGPTFLRRYFPFGVANFLERAWVFFIPLITLMIPSLQVAPPVYRWRIRRKIYVWYNDLHDLERRGFEAPDAAARDKVLEEIQALQHEVGRVDVPVSYNDELYHLRSHINFVEALIARQAVKNA